MISGKADEALAEACALASDVALKANAARHTTTAIFDTAMLAAIFLAKTCL